MDWNWFFSAVAQSCAAIVGIIGAFVFTKVIDNQRRFAARMQTYREYIATSKRLGDEAGTRRFEWVARENNESKLNEFVNDIMEHEVLLSPEEYYESGGFYPYEPREEVLDRIVTVVEHEGNRRNAPPRPKGPLGFDLGYIRRPSPLPFFRPKNWDSINAEEERINSYLVRLKDHIRRLKRFVTESNDAPEYSTLVSWVLVLGAVLFFCGVVYPLSFLPVNTGADLVIAAHFFWEILFSLKGLILLVVSLVFVVIFCVLFVGNLRLRLSDSELEDLGPWIVVENYSDSLRTMEKNTRQMESKEEA